METPASITGAVDGLLLLLNLKLLSLFKDESFKFFSIVVVVVGGGCDSPINDEEVATSLIGLDDVDDDDQLPLVPLMISLFLFANSAESQAEADL